MKFRNMPKERARDNTPKEIELGKLFARWLRKAMLDVEMNAVELEAACKRLGMPVSDSYIGTLLANGIIKSTGKYQPPGPEIIRAVATATGADEDEGRVAAGLLPLSRELTHVPDLSILRKTEGYNDLDEDAQRDADVEFREGVLDVAEMAIARARRKLRRRESIGGIGQN